jgi:ELWxxDGT repeat protein
MTVRRSLPEFGVRGNGPTSRGAVLDFLDDGWEISTMSPGGGAGPRAAAIVATAAVAFAAAVWAQPVPYLVKDIHQTPNPRASANPRLIRSAGDVAFFAAQGHDGLDLWRTDGTAPGTFRLAAVRNGIAEMVTVGARAFLSVYGSGLWVSDGTVAGTRYLGPPLDPVSRRHPQRLTPVGSLLLYAFSDPEHGVEVWRSDGTVGGTFMVVDLRPGPEDGLHPFDSTPFAVVAGEAFYRGFPDESGVEVRATSGAPGESRLVWSFPSPIGLGPLRAVGGRLWFTVWDGEQGVELWDSDGTTMGTHMVVDPPDLVDVDSVATVGDRTYFAATRPTEGTELWSTDGSPGGLGLVADVHPGPASSRPRELLGAGEALYFLADPPPDEPGGPASDQLWTLVGDELTAGGRRIDAAASTQLSAFACRRR